MPVHDPDPNTSRHLASDTDRAARLGRHDLDDPDPRYGDESRPVRDPCHEDRDSRPVAAGHRPEALRAEGESNYYAAATNPPTHRGVLRIELPDHDPVITPGVAGALLRLILKAAEHRTDAEHPPSGRTP
jgi:hypothetical protein